LNFSLVYTKNTSGCATMKGMKILKAQ